MAAVDDLLGMEDNNNEENHSKENQENDNQNLLDLNCENADADNEETGDEAQLKQQQQQQQEEEKAEEATAVEDTAAEQEQQQQEQEEEEEEAEFAADQSAAGQEFEQVQAQREEEEKEEEEEELLELELEKQQQEQQQEEEEEEEKAQEIGQSVEGHRINFSAMQPAAATNGTDACRMCAKKVYPMEMLTSDGHIYHKSCYRCFKCKRQLSFGNFGVLNNQLYCQPHYIEIFKLKGNYCPTESAPTEIIAGDEKRDDGISHVQKLSNIKSKFESQGDEQQSTAGNRKEKVYYAGLQSARTKYESAASTDSQSDKRARNGDQPKRFTPPRDEGEGGVYESQPADLPPDVVRSGDRNGNNGEIGEMLPKPGASRDALARFKEMELQQQQQQQQQPLSKEPRQRSASRISAVWEKAVIDEAAARSQSHSDHKLDPLLDIKSLASNAESTAAADNCNDGSNDNGNHYGNHFGNEQQQQQQCTKRLKERFLMRQREEEEERRMVEKKPIKLDEGEGGIFENNPIQLPDVIRSDTADSSWSDYRQYATAGCATVAKEKFISEAQRCSSNGERRVELELANDSGVYENVPEVRSDVVRAGAVCDADADYDASAAFNKAVSAWHMQQMGDADADAAQPKQLDIDPTSGGIFENNPAPLAADIIRHSDVASASSSAQQQCSARQAKQIYERSLSGSKASAAVNQQLELGEGGVYENQPVQQLPDVVQRFADPQEEAMRRSSEILGIKGATSAAKRQLLLKQNEGDRLMEDKRNTPGMIDIWAELSEHSGVFENEPQQRPADVIGSNNNYNNGYSNSYNNDNTNDNVVN